MLYSCDILHKPPKVHQDCCINSAGHEKQQSLRYATACLPCLWHGKWTCSLWIQKTWGENTKKNHWTLDNNTMGYCDIWKFITKNMPRICIGSVKQCWEKPLEVEKVASINWGIPWYTTSGQSHFEGGKIGCLPACLPKAATKSHRNVSHSWLNGFFLYHISASWRHNLDIFEFSKHLRLPPSITLW